MSSTNAKQFKINFNNGRIYEVQVSSLEEAKNIALDHVSLTNQDIVITDQAGNVVAISHWVFAKPMGHSIELCEVAGIGYYKQWVDYPEVDAYDLISQDAPKLEGPFDDQEHLTNLLKSLGNVAGSNYREQADNPSNKTTLTELLKDSKPENQHDPILDGGPVGKELI